LDAGKICVDVHDLAGFRDDISGPQVLAGSKCFFGQNCFFEALKRVSGRIFKISKLRISQKQSKSLQGNITVFFSKILKTISAHTVQKVPVPVLFNFYNIHLVTQSF
jgi:hypothetical protein